PLLPTDSTSPVVACTYTPPPQTPAPPLHDALPISDRAGEPDGPRRAAGDERAREADRWPRAARAPAAARGPAHLDHAHPPLRDRSEEHTSELQSRFDLVCRLLLAKKRASQLHVARL